ncbi:MAG: hypothetical protein QF733_08280 [Phycisphaerales bacterium]|jgi:hypothetical protein|nr:hypothetical protein [Phycisphaerales bacterium]
MIPYRHVQPGWLIRVALGIPLVAAALTGFATQPEVLLAAVALVVALLLFHSLSVEVSHDDITVAFGIGVIRRTIPLARVASCAVVQTPWYYGWGIRYVFKGWMWNVSGFHSVELTYTDGGHFRIGTDQPEALAAAIEAARASCAAAA